MRLNIRMDIRTALNLFESLDSANDWRHHEKDAPGHFELCIGTQIITLNTEKKVAEMDGGPFYSTLEIEGDTEEELKADAIRKGWDKVVQHMKEFRDIAKEHGVDLGDETE